MQPLLLPHATAILERVDGITLPGGDPIVIGDHKAPKSGTGSVVAPCSVFYLRPGGQQSGDLNQTEVDAWLPFQFTNVGHTAAQAMMVADIVHEALTASPLTIDGRLVARLRRTFFGSTAQRDDDVTPPLFYVPSEYRAWTLTTGS